MQFDQLKRREFITLLGGAAAAWPLAARKATLASLLRRAAPGVRLNEHVEADGPTVFAHACRPGVRGGAARGGRGLEPMTEGKNRIMLYGAGADRPGRL